MSEMFNSHQINDELQTQAQNNLSLEQLEQNLKNMEGKEVRLSIGCSNGTVAIIDLDSFKFSVTYRKDTLVFKNDYEFDGRIYVTTKQINNITVEQSEEFEDPFFEYKVYLNDGSIISLCDQEEFEELKAERERQFEMS